jgi:hypothetical protein
MKLDFQSDSEYIQTVLKDERFPVKTYFWTTNQQPREDLFRVENNQVVGDFTRADGVKMQFYAYFVAPKDFVPYMIVGTRFL